MEALDFEFVGANTRRLELTDEPLQPLEGWILTKIPFQFAVHSFVSGPESRRHINVKYYKTKAPNTLYAKIIFGPLAEGPPGHAHGGAQAAALDEICGGALLVWDKTVLAAKLETSFHHLVPLNTELMMEARLVKEDGRKLFTEGAIKTLNGKTLASAKVLFIEASEKTIFTLRRKLEEKS